MKTINRKLLFSAAVLTIALGGLISCSKKSSGPPPITPLGGFVSSDSVEPQALVAYWPMDGALTETKGGISTTGVNVTYGTGVRGQAYQGSATSYASFTPNAALIGLQSYSVSLWYWQPAQPVNTPSNDPQGMFFLADANTNPDLIVENEHFAPVSGDSVEIHAGCFFPAASQWNGWTMSTFDTAGIGKWVHFVMSYNGGTSTYTVYQDGQAMNNQSAYGVATATQLLQGPSGSTPQGNLNWTAAPPTIGTIGTWAPGTYGVSPTLGSNGNYQGKLDEIRVFNIALKPQDVAGLYLNGQAGR